MPLASRSTMVRIFGLLLAVFGLVGQLSFGGVAQRSDDAAAAVVALAAASVDCHLAAPVHDDRSRHRPHRSEPSLCPAQLTLGQTTLTITPSIDVPDTEIAAPLRSGLPPPSRGPPQATARVGQPRGPPVQV